ncbi:MAG: zf-HC2 domain-containing protein [Candidatus Nanopelagicales bacterium]
MADETRIPLMRGRSCERVRSLMSDHLDGDLDARTRRRVNRHVRFCRRCRRVLGNLRVTIDGLARLADPDGHGAGGDTGEGHRRRRRASGGP